MKEKVLGLVSGLIFFGGFTLLLIHAFFIG